MNVPIDPSQQTSLHQFADTLSKWCRKAIVVPRKNEREEGEQEEEFSFGIDESMWDQNSMWHLYDDYKVEECEDFDEKGVLDIILVAEQQMDEQGRSTSTKVAISDVLEGEWDDAEVDIDSAKFDQGPELCIESV